MLVNINLLPQKERDRPIYPIAAASIVLLAIIAGSVLFFMAQSLDKERADLTVQSTQIAAEQEAVRQQIEANSGLNEEQQLKETVDWAESYQFDTVPLLGELVSILPDHGFFNSFSYIGPNAATLTLQFDTAREAAYYLTQLKSSEVLASATLDSVANQDLETAEDETAIEVEEEIIQNPRYLATYSLVFVDERIPAEGTAVAEDGTVIEEEAAETPAAETAPEETEGDAQ